MKQVSLRTLARNCFFSEAKKNLSLRSVQFCFSGSFSILWYEVITDGLINTTTERAAEGCWYNVRDWASNGWGDETSGRMPACGCRAHLGSGRRCRCRGLPLRPSGAAGYNTAGGGRRKAGCWPSEKARLERTLPSCRRSWDCGSLSRSAEVSHPQRLDLQNRISISFDPIWSRSRLHALNKHFLLPVIWDGNNNAPHFQHWLTGH